MDVRNFFQIGCHVVEFCGVLENRERILVHLPVKGRGDLSDQAHGLEPARSGCLEVKSTLGQSSDLRENSKFITSRMNGDLVVSVMLGDQAMLEILLPKGSEVSDVVDALLKFSNEPRSERVEL